MSVFLSHIHAEMRRARLTMQGATHRAEDVPQGMHKAYPRMPQISLPEPKAISMTLPDALLSRSSSTSGDPDIEITQSEVGTLLGLSLGKRPRVNNRNYPSGGVLFPIETYLISTALEGERAGVFHYNPTLHALERLIDLPNNFTLNEIAKKPDSLLLSTLIVFTSVWQRSSAKYGDLTYVHALLEAGHMSQNILLVATALSLNARPYAGFDDSVIAQLLDLNELEEQSVHSITLCKEELNTTYDSR